MSVSVFKSKTNKSVNFDNRISLHTKHREYVQILNDEQSSISDFHSELVTLEKEIAEMNEKVNKMFEDNEYQKITKEILDVGTQLGEKHERVNELKKKISDVEKNSELNNYYLDLADIYFKFYSNSNGSANNGGDNNLSTQLGSLVIKRQYNKEKVLNVYLHTLSSRFGDDSINDYLFENTIKVPNSCNNCGSVSNFDTFNGKKICRDCGTEELIITEMSKPSYKEKSADKPYPFSYKKLNHFNEWINQIQGKEVTKIPKKVFDKLLLEIRKERITDTRLITQKKVRSYLKKLKETKYYEHVPYITQQLDGERPPQIPISIENQLRKMFIEISAPFIRYCPKNRRNFPRYTFIIYKCCELIGYSEILPYLPLLKTRSRLIQMDSIWKKATDQLGWKYIRTI